MLHHSEGYLINGRKHWNSKGDHNQPNPPTRPHRFDIL